LAISTVSKKVAQSIRSPNSFAKSGHPAPAAKIRITGRNYNSSLLHLITSNGGADSINDRIIPRTIYLCKNSCRILTYERCQVGVASGVNREVRRIESCNGNTRLDECTVIGGGWYFKQFFNYISSPLGGGGLHFPWKKLCMKSDKINRLGHFSPTPQVTLCGYYIELFFTYLSYNTEPEVQCNINIALKYVIS
jgi:hypothetical protein